MGKPVILIVDDEPNNIKLLSQILQKEYKLRIALNGYEALERVFVEPYPDLVILDIMMPGMDGYEVSRKLKSDPRVASIPVIFVSAKSEIADETHGFDVGAVDFISKPVSPAIVKARVATHISLSDQKKACEILVQKRTSELQAVQKASIYMIGEAGHYNDTDTGLHIWRMAAYSRLIAQFLGWPNEKSEMLELASPMHDTGKIGIPDSILKAPRKLSSDEWIEMKKHCRIGYSILSKSDTPLFKLAAEVALYHHERWDGEGYPTKISSDDIPESAQIVAIADVFDALTMRRPYKKPWPLADAFEEINNGSGSHFRPDLVKVFLGMKPELEEIKVKWDKTEEKPVKQV